MHRQLILIISIFITLYSDDYIKLKKDMYIRYKDSSFDGYNLTVLKNIALNLKLETIPQMHISYKLGYYNKKASFGFLYSELVIPNRYVNPKIAQQLPEEIRKKDSTTLYGLKVWLPDSRRTRDNFYKFLISAYKQETEGIKDSSAYFRLPPKSFSEMKKRAWISAGLGIKYMYDDNPFFSGNSFAQFCYYFFDIAYLSAIIVGPIVSKETKYKIGFPILGLIGLLEFRLLPYLFLKKEFNKYNSIQKSGYYLPKNIKCRNCEIE